MRGFFQDDQTGSRSMTRLVLFCATTSLCLALLWLTYWSVRTGRDYSKAIEQLAWATVACGVGYVSKSLAGTVTGFIEKLKGGKDGQ